LVNEAASTLATALGGNSYATASNATVTLVQAVTLSNDITVLNGITLSASYAISLNGKNLTVKAGGTFAKPTDGGWGSGSGSGGSLIIEAGGIHTISDNPWAGSADTGQYQIESGGKLTITPPNSTNNYWAYAIEGPVSLLKNGTATSSDVAVAGTFYDALTVKNGAVFTVTGDATGIYADDPEKPGIKGEGNGKIVLVGEGKEIGVDRNSVDATSRESYDALPGITTEDLHDEGDEDSGPWSDIDGFVTTDTYQTTFIWSTNEWQLYRGSMGGEG
jgi:hypothetical protein